MSVSCALYICMYGVKGVVGNYSISSGCHAGEIWQFLLGGGGGGGLEEGGQ
jgi:hypothetical protein